MAYEPTEWKKGDVVTSQKLNKLEQGVANAGGVTVLNEDENEALDKTWSEIFSAMQTDIVVVKYGNSLSDIHTLLVDRVFSEVDLYSVVCGDTTYVTTSSDGNPTLSAPRT